MDGLNFLEVVNSLGLPGLIFVIWYFDKVRLDKSETAKSTEIAQMQRQHEEALAQQREEHREMLNMEKEKFNELLTVEREKLTRMEAYQKDMISSFKSNRDAILAQFEKYMNEMRGMYTNNVSLVKSYQEIAKDIKEAYMLATREVAVLREELKNDHKNCVANRGFGCLIPADEERTNGKRITQ